MARGLGVSVRIEGVEKLRAKLARVTDTATSEAVVRAAVKDAAEPMRKTASDLAPVGTRRVNRKRLHEGIVIRPAKGKGVWEQIAPLREVAHANLQEFGTVHHAAQPFMRPAFDQKKGEAVEIVRRQLKDAIEKAAGGS